MSDVGATKRWLSHVALELGIAALAVLLSLGAGAILIVLQGHSPFEVYGVLFSEALGSAAGLAQVTFKATTLVFTGLAAAFAFRAGMFNIGAEGQLYLGAFAAAVLALALPASTPALVAMPVLVLAAFAGGALAAAIPAVLKATRGTHEVINTMMMNFIVVSVVNWLLGFLRESPEVVRTAHVPDAWQLPTFVRGFDGNAALFVALVAALVVAWLFARTRTGYELRAVGLSPGAAEFGGIAVPRMMVISLLVSGGIAGLGGVNFVLGSPGYFEQHFAPFQGYLGIAVALLARNHPVGIVPAAFLFAAMAEGSQSIQQYVPKELGNILQSIVVVFVILGARAASLAIAAWQQRALTRAGGA
ncbi:ABC transporter permease [Myxococcota bacterium]|nr:ABC transporter permease [Myxococcota bacterium]